MKCVGVIAEFNPFHNGHRYLIRSARELSGADVCVAVMSGPFTQRGLPAAEDKWKRAENAVRGGVNLVLEMPVVYAAGSAQYFARGGVRVLEGLGCVDVLAFGSESGDLRALAGAASFLADHGETVGKRIGELTKQGFSYPRARQKAVQEIDPSFDVSLIAEPNNILALEYMRECRNMRALTVKRVSGEGYPSSTALREKMMREQADFYAAARERLFSVLAGTVLSAEDDAFDDVPAAAGGLGRRLVKKIRLAGNTEELIGQLKTKAYTRTRIQRLLTHVLTGLRKTDMENAAVYARILAFDRKGAELIKSVKKTECASIPVLTNISKEAEQPPGIQRTLARDVHAADMYNLIIGNDLYKDSDFVKRPFFFRSSGKQTRNDASPQERK